MNIINNKLFGGFLACAALFIPLTAAAETIQVDPLAWDYGEVDIGDSDVMVFTIQSIGPLTPLLIKRIVIEDDDTGAYELSEVIPDVILPHSLDVGETLEAVVTFAPTEEGLATADLLIESDAHIEPCVYVPLQGVGIDESTPEALMADAIEFFDASLANGTIYGAGRGRSATAHLSVFAGMLDQAADLIAAGDDTGACKQLAKIADRCDSASPPPDLIGGSSAYDLYLMILDVMEALGC